MKISNNRQPNHHFEYCIYVNNSKQKVWDYLTKVSRWKEWDTELLDTKLSERFMTGAKGILISRRGPKLDFLKQLFGLLLSKDFRSVLPEVIQRTGGKRIN